jgi:hypothetical protein
MWTTVSITETVGGWEKRNAGCDRIAQDSLVLLVEYEDPHDPGSHTPASLDTINSALQSQAIALLQLIVLRLLPTPSNV